MISGSKSKFKKSRNTPSSASGKKLRLPTSPKTRNLSTVAFNTEAKLKRKSPILSFLDESETNIDKDYIDEKVDKLWGRFVIYNHYEKRFSISNIILMYPNITSIKTKEDVDFDLKLCTYFTIYHISKGANFNLISNSVEGSYLLNQARIWIIYIHILFVKYHITFQDLFDVFNYSLEHEVDEYLLFDFFLTLAEEYTEEEILELNTDKKIPLKFIEIWNNNKEHVMDVLKTKNEISTEGDLEKKEDEIPEEKIADKEATPDNNDNIKRISVIQERNKESEDRNSIDDNNEKNYLSTPENPRTVKSKKNAFRTLFNKDQDLEDAIIAESNLRNQGNFAILELSAKSQDKVGHRYVLTPISKYKDKREVEKDLQIVHAEYPDFLYQPFDESIVKNLTVLGKRLSFSKIDNNITSN